MDFLSSFLGRNGLLPHGYCISWDPTLLWTMVSADVLIAAAYFSIPLAIISFVYKRRGESPGWVPWLFSAFIFACGLTHVMEVWTLWNPDYGLLAIAKVATAAVSVPTAVVLWALIPKALRLPSVAQLQRAIASLEAEVVRRRSAEQHLSDVEQSLAVTLATIEAGFIATDAQGRVTRMNAVAESITGWGQSAARGQSLWHVFQREGRSEEMLSRNPVDVVVEMAITADLAHRVVVIARDGTRTPLEAKVAPTHGDDGQVRGIALVFRDMTRLNHAETAVHRLAAIVESSSDAIIGKTLEGRITSWNKAATSMFGYSAEEAIGQPIQMLIPPELAAQEMQILTDLSQGRTVPAFDTLRQTKHGVRLEVSITISPIRDAMGAIVGASKIARDISHQRRAEAALRESEARLRLALDVAHVGDWDIELATGLTRHSVRHDRCFGYDRYPGEWTVQTFLQHVHPEDRQAVNGSLVAAQRVQNDWHENCRVVWPDGSVHWISVHLSLLFQAAVPVRLLGAVTDITTQKLAEDARLKAERLEAENRQIQEASRLKSQFLANMSHELRTPLNAIIGFAELLHAGAVPNESPKHQEFLGHIASSGHHLLQLINDVLDLSKVESGKFEFVPEPVQLDRLVQEVRDVLHNSIQKKHLKLALDMDPALTDVVVDPARLKQVLYNYLSNAIKFTPDRGHITVRTLPDGAAHFRIEVEDTGIGIAEHDLPRLFVEFQQLDAGYDKQHQGTGLGLALTRRLVHAQGGSVGVRSTPGEGSTFHLVLPRQPVVALEEPAVERRLLVIDSNFDGQQSMVRSLQDSGFQIDTAATGAQALRRSALRAYDALTLELLLPDLRGLDVLASIRTQGTNRSSPVLGVTLDTDDEGKAAFPIADVLCKPLRSDEVLSALGRLGMQGAHRTQGTRGITVMVVDDDPLARDLMQATLQAAGVRSACFASGREALAGLDHVRPDGIILDLMMPEMDGFAVLERLQRLPAWRTTPVFIWTSMLLTDDEYLQLLQSARAVLRKGGGALDVLLERLRLWRPADSPERSAP